jgi:hypothetical protein
MGDGSREHVSETGADAEPVRLRGQTLRLTEPAWRQLKLLAIEEDRSVHSLLIEAVNDLFRKRGKPEVAQETRPGSTIRRRG